MYYIFIACSFYIEILFFQASLQHRQQLKDLVDSPITRRSYLVIINDRIPAELLGIAIGIIDITPFPCRGPLQ